MMNDRFSSQLRQHLVTTANERPADGQLAAVIDGVELTAQRHPLVARLTWFPGRFGPFPSTALRYGLVALALIGALLAVAILGGGSTPNPPTVFEGTWFSIDPGDGSTQTLTVAAGASPNVHFEDERSTGGACVADVDKRFTADGFGQIDGARLHVSFPDGGGCGLQTVAIGPGFYDYQAPTDTLLDGDGLSWSRVEEGGLPPTEIPATAEPPARPTPDPQCLDLDGGGVYGAGVGSLSVSVTLGPETSWEGRRDRFRLARYGCEGWSPVWLEAQVVTEVQPDACDRSGPAVEVADATEAVAALAAQASIGGDDPVEATLDGYVGSRLTMYQSPDFNTSACTDGVLAPLSDVSGMDSSQTLTAYVVDVEGTTLAVAIYWGPDVEPAVRAQADAIVASLQIEP